MKANKLITAALSVAVVTTAVNADVTLVVTGGNASKTVLFDRAAALLTGATVLNGANSNTRSYLNGTIAGQPGLGHVTIHFVQNGAAQGLLDLKNQAAVPSASGALTAQLAVSGTFPETIGIDSSIFVAQRTLVVPFVFIKNGALANSLHGVTNLTQRQAAYLEAASGTLPTAFFGGESTSDPLYLIGRNTGAAVRQVIDASIYFAGAPAFYTTNNASYASFGPPYSTSPIGSVVLHPQGGHNSGAAVTNDLVVIPNAIGTVSSQDAVGFTALSYEGVPFSTANVINGSYPIWGYEAWYYKNSGTGQLSANQLAVITALYNAVTDNTYQHTLGNPFATARFVPLADLEVERTADGGPITSTIY